MKRGRERCGGSGGLEGFGWGSGRGVEADGFGAEEEEDWLFDFFGFVFLLGVGAFEAGVDVIEGGLEAAEGGAEGYISAREWMGHISIQSRLDCAVPNDFFSVDFFGCDQFRRALWCQWICNYFFWGSIFG